MNVDLDDLYQEIILDHHRHGRNRGTLPSPDLEAHGFNPFCGDEVVLTARVDDAGRIAETGIGGQGCAISQASASIMSEMVKGQHLDQALELGELFKSVMAGHQPTDEEADRLGELAALEGVQRFPVRVKCALLAWSTLQDAVGQRRKGDGG